VFDCAIEHQEARRVSLQIGDIEVAFYANNEYAGSPVIASLDAAEEAVRDLRRKRNSSGNPGDG
jgi:hypothetical protein